ncbi:MAG: hypothetical protein K5872_16625 [Rhizobiaceae bacterium]|nr:hypothetical protein [Rhizobiaceae bacterium]MCV0407848.1 hypothetical protein [Rhizobiaceae bacterium]
MSKFALAALVLGMSAAMVPTASASSALARLCAQLEARIDALPAIDHPLDGEWERLTSAYHANRCDHPYRRLVKSSYERPFSGRRVLVRAEPAGPRDPALRVDEATQGVSGGTPVPTPRPISDWEAYADREHGMPLATAGRIAAAATLSQARELTPEERKVRVVGWKFLPDESEDIDLRAASRSATHPANELFGRAFALVGQLIGGSAVAGEVPEERDTETASVDGLEAASLQ